MKPNPSALATYDDVADEYYDSALHPTCANFGELSARFLGRQLRAAECLDKNVLEVGCGRSITAEILAHAGAPLNRLTLLDLSSQMLGHSRHWQDQGAKLIVADAKNTQLPPRNYHVIVSSLGDPYNVPEFWSEVKRLLTHDGICLFTTPSYEWAHRFRRGADFRSAEFLRADGLFVAVPSEILPLQGQLELIKNAGLSVENSTPMRKSELSGRLSPKLVVNSAPDDYAVVEGFEITKRA